MSDPAVEAARRAWAKDDDNWFPAGATEGVLMIEAAREALAPIREVMEEIYGECLVDSSLQARQVSRALDRIAVHVYPSEEL